nr:hypothetical protein BaRGS_031349 [Batillaria attramentaria]
MFSLVMAAAYSGTLTAFLSATKDTQLFSSLQDLVTKEHDYTWGTPGGTALTVFLQRSNETILRDVWAGMKRFEAEDPDVFSENITKLAEKVVSEDFVLFQSEVFAMSLFGDECDVAVVPVGPVVISLLHVQGVFLVVSVGLALALVVLMASDMEQEYGTQSAFGMSSRWLLIPTGGDNLLDHLHVSNVTMDNVAVADFVLGVKVVGMMDFSVPVLYTPIVMVYRKPEVVPHLQTLPGPLSMTVLWTVAYSGTLTAFLSATKDTQLFTSLQDLVTKQHDYNIQRLHNNGILSKWTDTWFPLTSCLVTPGPKVISLPHVQGFLLVVPVGLGLALVASNLEREYGTLSAFGMSSRWLLMPTGGDNLLDHLHVSNVTMDNVALFQQGDPPGHGDDCVLEEQTTVHTLLWLEDGRSWANTGHVVADNTKRHSVTHSDNAERTVFPNLQQGLPVLSTFYIGML